MPFPGGLACSRSLHVLLVSAYSGVLPHSRDMLTSCARVVNSKLFVGVTMDVCLSPCQGATPPSPQGSWDRK